MNYNRFIEPSTLIEQQRLAGLNVVESALSSQEQQALYSISQGHGLIRGAPQAALDVWRSLHQKGYVKWPKNVRRGKIMMTAAGNKALAKAQGGSTSEKKRPAKKEVDALIAAFASYLAVQDKADVKVQQRMYDAYRKKLDAMAEKYPYMDMSSTDFQAGLEKRARDLMKKQPIKYSGTPGASY